MMNNYITGGLGDEGGGGEISYACLIDEEMYCCFCDEKMFTSKKFSKISSIGREGAERFPFK